MKIVLLKKVEDYILNLKMPDSAKISRTIELLEQFGSNLGMPHSKKINNKLFELRARGKREIRIIYTFHENEIVLVHIFTKKTRKIPKKEISTAEKRLNSLD